MRRFFSVIIFGAAVSIVAIAAAQETEIKKVTTADTPSGMEMIQIGSTEVMVPKDYRVYKRNNITVLEPTIEYVTRKLVTIEERLAAIETIQQGLSDKIDTLTGMVAELQKNAKGVKGDVPQGDAPPEKATHSQ